MTVRALPYPILEDDALSYPDGQYNVEIRKLSDDNAFSITHTVIGASFINKALDEGRARCGCLVAIPMTGYRKLHLADAGRRELEISWEDSVVGQPPSLRPLILTTEKIECELTATDGVDEAWHQTVAFPKGARLAVKHYYRQVASLAGMLRIRVDPERKAGTFRVGTSQEEGFFFDVRVAADMFAFIRKDSNHSYIEHRGSVYTHIISKCFEILRADFSKPDDDGNPEWENYPNLKALSEQLEQQELPHWANEEEFSAEEVATAMHPHKFPMIAEDED